MVSAGATSELVDLFADLDEVLNNQLDPLMEKFQETEPAFYHEYESARVVVDAAATHGSKDAPGPAATATPTNVTPALASVGDTAAPTPKGA